MQNRKLQIAVLGGFAALMLGRGVYSAGHAGTSLDVTMFFACGAILGSLAWSAWRHKAA